jgi:mono/diheme cytochrome c family protein
MIQGLIYLMLTTVLVSPGRAPQEDAASVDPGRRLFTQRCSGCHGENGEGRESTERTFSVELRHLGSEEVQESTDAELRTLLLEGGKRAKPVRNLSPEDANNVIRFLRTLRLEE